jgi:Arc-like DNA binding domain
MKTETARRGAPVTARRRIPMGIRVTPELRNQLLASAEASGRSITSEMELRLENSFRSERYLDEALDLAFGRQATGLLKAIARVMVDVGPHAAMAKNGSFESVRPSSRWHQCAPGGHTTARR